MKSDERIKLHDGEVVTESDEGRDVDDVAGVVPEMRHELERARRGEPDGVAQNDIPGSVGWEC